MPKATVHKNGSPILAHHDVSRTGHRTDVEPIAVAMAPEPFADQQLGLGALTADSAHTIATLR